MKITDIIIGALMGCFVVLACSAYAGVITYMDVSKAQGVANVAFLEAEVEKIKALRRIATALEHIEEKTP